MLSVRCCLLCLCVCEPYSLASSPLCACLLLVCGVVRVFSWPCVRRTWWRSALRWSSPIWWSSAIRGTARRRIWRTAQILTVCDRISTALPPLLAHHRSHAGAGESALPRASSLLSYYSSRFPIQQAKWALLLSSASAMRAKSRGLGEGAHVDRRRTTEGDLELA